MEEDIVDLPPKHVHAKVNGHAHSHGGHGHSHEGHGHGHSHGGHGHSHGAQRELTPEERERARKKLHKNWDDDDEEEFSSVSLNLTILRFCRNFCLILV